MFYTRSYNLLWLRSDDTLFVLQNTSLVGHRPDLEAPVVLPSEIISQHPLLLTGDHRNSRSPGEVKARQNSLISTAPTEYQLHYSKPGRVLEGEARNRKD